MARFLSPAWADQLNAAFAGGSNIAPDPDGGLATLDGTFTVVQEVRNAPEGNIRVILQVADGSMSLSVSPSGGPDKQSDQPDTPVPDVTIAISYVDAAAMSKGELSPAEALNGGRIRVRGDLSVLVAAQKMLLAAHSSAQGTVEETTY